MSRAGNAKSVLANAQWYSISCGVGKQAEELLPVILHKTILHRFRNYPVPMRTLHNVDHRVLGQQRNYLTNVQAAVYS